MPVEPCPFLPDIGSSRFPASALSQFRDGPRGPEFYLLAHRCAQSRWLESLPAQALLMLNRAMGASLADPADLKIVGTNPIPYRAVGWILRHGESISFLGNPRRHFQHLASRMSGHDRALRTARAWACWELAKAANPDWPADREQIERESLVEPGHDMIEENLSRLGLPGEVEEWQVALGEL